MNLFNPKLEYEYAHKVKYSSVLFLFGVLSFVFYSTFHIRCDCLSGGAEFFQGPARRKRGGQEEAGGGRSQSYTVGGRSDRSYPEGPPKGN